MCRSVFLLFLSLPAFAAPLTYTDVTAGSQHTPARYGDSFCHYAGTSSFSCLGWDATFGGSGATVAFNGIDSVFVNASSHGASQGLAMGMVTDNTIYNVGAALAVNAVLSLNCMAHNGGAVYYGINDSAASALCVQGQYGPSLAPATYASTMLVPLQVVGGQVQLNLSLMASAQGDADNNVGSISLQLVQLQDGAGTPVSASVVPEPSTWGMLAVGISLLAFHRVRS